MSIVDEFQVADMRDGYHRCPVCKKPMKRVETEHYGPGWSFDCKCLDSQADGGDES